MNVDVKKIGTEIKQVVTDLYGSRFSELILFGSYARGDFHEESDYDFAIVFDDADVSPSTEILKIGTYTAEIGLRYGAIISILPVSKTKLKNSQLSVYQNIRREGLSL